MLRGIFLCYNLAMNWSRFEVFMEFAVFGIVIGVIEDLIAVKLVTGEAITWHVVGLVVLIAIPFAALGELVVDRVNFVKLFQNLSNKK